MQKLERLNIGVSGTDYYFTENEHFVKYLQELYPQFKFETTLSLSAFSQRNLHQLVVPTPTGSNLTYASVEVQDAIVEGLCNLLDRSREDMYRAGIKSATVHLSRVTVGANASALSLKTELFANLRACFIPE